VILKHQEELKELLKTDLPQDVREDLLSINRAIERLKAVGYFYESV